MTSKRMIGFLFSGQGAQSVGMLRTIAEKNPPAMRLFQEANRVLGYDIIRAADDPNELNKTSICQPAMFLSGLAATEAFSSDNTPKCDAAAGLSLGEYTALTYAGAFTFEDGLRLVQLRADLMQKAAEASPSGMCSLIGMDQSVAQSFISKILESSKGSLKIANFLAPQHMSLSGDISSLQLVEQLGRKSGAKMAKRLNVAAAFHSEFMESAVAPLQKALQQVNVQAPKLPVIANVDGRPYQSASDVVSKLGRQIVEPVQWEKSMEFLMGQGYRDFYEMGWGSSLIAMLKRSADAQGFKIQTDNVFGG